MFRHQCSCLKEKLLANVEEREAVSIACNSLRPLQAKSGTAPCCSRWTQMNGKPKMITTSLLAISFIIYFLSHLENEPDAYSFCLEFE